MDLTGKIKNLAVDYFSKNITVTLEINEAERFIKGVDELKKLEKLLWKKDNTARELLLKNCPDRLHTIYTGMLILDELVELSQCETIYISQYGVREGYLRRELARKRKA